MAKTTCDCGYEKVCTFCQEKQIRDNKNDKIKTADAGLKKT
ncbi:hypothetical protein [Blautia glucerasea]|nr:hypothetical protein [Blautia glucerasea]